MEKALGKIDFLRFFKKEFNKFRRKLDMDFHFLKKNWVKIGNNYSNFQKKKKTQKKKRKKKKIKKNKKKKLKKKNEKKNAIHI